MALQLNACTALAEGQRFLFRTTLSSSQLPVTLAHIWCVHAHMHTGARACMPTIFLKITKSKGTVLFTLVAF